MENGIDVLFLNEDLFIYLCSSIKLASVKVIRSGERSVSEEYEGASEGNITGFLNFGFREKKSSSEKNGLSYEVTPMQLFNDFYSDHSRFTQIPDYLKASELKTKGITCRIVCIRGLLSWQDSSRKSEWPGDLVVYQKPTDHNPRAIIRLFFDNPVNPRAVPSDLHGYPASVFTLWEPDFNPPMGSTIGECKVIAVVKPKQGDAKWLKLNNCLK